MIEVYPDPDALLATPSFRELESQAAHVFSSDPIQAALKHVYRLAEEQPQAQLPAGATTLHHAMQEMAFAFVVRNLNADPLHAQILWDQHPPHCYGELRIPGSRAIGNNPDNIYRRIPLDPGERYVLHGQLAGPPAPDITFSVLPHVSMQAERQPTTLTLADIDVDDHGAFALTLNGENIEGQRNHVYLAPGTTRMTIRESMTDWAVDTPMQLTLTHEPAAQNQTSELEAVAKALATRLPAFVEHWLKFNNNTYFAHASNFLPKAERPPGGLMGQTSVMGNYALEAGEVLILRATTLGASYFSFAVMDPWMRCADFETRTASLTATQAVADQDGGYTVVMGLEDPGLHNWLDVGGLTEGTWQIRWQGIPGGTPTDGFFAASKSTVQQLKTVLPEETVWVTHDQRAAQLAARNTAFNRRFTLKAPQ